jgi:hypothetical protein
MLAYFEKKYNPTNIEISLDIRHFGLDIHGTVYEECGFSVKSITEPNYWLVKKGSMLMRIPSEDVSKEEQNESCYLRLWGCGFINLVKRYG